MPLGGKYVRRSPRGDFHDNGLQNLAPFGWANRAGSVYNNTNRWAVLYLGAGGTVSGWCVAPYQSWSFGAPRSGIAQSPSRSIRRPADTASAWGDLWLPHATRQRSPLSEPGDDVRESTQLDVWLLRIGLMQSTLSTSHQHANAERSSGFPIGEVR
jgi:hypothetical protein